jgi:hypothetical protein
MKSVSSKLLKHDNNSYKYINKTNQHSLYKCINNQKRKILCKSFLKVIYKDNQILLSSPHSKKCQYFCKKNKNTLIEDKQDLQKELRKDFSPIINEYNDIKNYADCSALINSVDFNDKTITDDALCKEFNSKNKQNVFDVEFEQKDKLNSLDENNLNLLNENILKDFFKFDTNKIFDINFNGRVSLNRHSFDPYETNETTHRCYNVEDCESILKICDLSKTFFVSPHSKICIDHRNKIQESSKKFFNQYPPISYKCYNKKKN